MRMRFAAVVAYLLLTSLFGSTAALAQATISFAQLNGTIVDSSGRSLPGAAIGLRNVDTNQSFQASTNTDGFFALANLPPGNYELTVTSKGFARYHQTGMRLTVGQVAHTFGVILRFGTPIDHVFT